MIRVEALGKTFGKVQAVQDVSFAADDGKVTALLGPNGAGKSTTLRILSTIVAPTMGHAFVDNVDVTREPMTARAKIGVLPHNAGIYGRLTAIENVRYFGELQGIAPDVLETRIDGLIERLEMREFCQRRTAGFSQGQRIKVALARALIHAPKHVLLDEPTNGLDVMATRGLRELILQLRGEGMCVLFSSHIMQEVANLCDDVVIIAHGCVKFQGTLDALRDAAGETDLEEAFISMVTTTS